MNSSLKLHSVEYSGGLEYQTIEFRTHLKFERFYIWIWDGSVLE